MPTRTVCRRILAPLLGVYEQGVATSGSTATTGVVCTGGSSATGLRFKSSVNSESLLEDKWIYRPAAAAANDLDRTISTYTPGSGTMAVEDAYSNAAYSGGAGETFEIHHLFSGTELNALLNEGLKRCMVVTEFTFTVASALTKRHSMAAEAWLTDPEWIYQVGVLASGESRNQVDPFQRRIHGRAHIDGLTIYIEGPSFNTSDTVYVKAAKPAYFACGAAATPTVLTQTALLLEADVAPVAADWLAWATIMAAADRLDSMESHGGGSKQARESRAVASARFSQRTRENFDEPDRTFVPMRTYISPTYQRPVRFR